MSEKLTENVLKRLDTERNIWVSTIRPQKNADHPVRPHLVPVWFAWSGGKIYLCMQSKSVKGKNLRKNPFISLALENGSNVVICEGSAARIEKADCPAPAKEILFKKYKWNIDDPEDAQYDFVAEITPKKWLTWGDEG